MKLDIVFVKQAVSQLQADPIPEEHPVMPQLNKVFGDDTFFLDSDGLYVVELGEPAEVGNPTGEVVRIAYWSDWDPDTLAVQRPEPTGIVVVFKDPDTPDHPDRLV